MKKPTLHVLDSNRPAPTDKIPTVYCHLAEQATDLCRAAGLTHEQTADVLALGIVAMLYRSDREHVRKFLSQLYVNLDHYNSD